MARYKKEVKLSEISEKGKNRVRKRFGDIVVFEMDSSREALMIQKFQEIEQMKLDSATKDFITTHAVITIFTNIRIDVEDKQFEEILKNPPMDLRDAVLEVQMMIAKSIASVTHQIEYARQMTQFKAMIASKQSDVSE